ncbi:MAG: LuxR C-terminal-related transcriptional regulator [Dehalococcoidia bacterium]|nr:LuxR C-terminal-related transcriptional regulator [Dehalococcoidia bacterium]
MSQTTDRSETQPGAPRTAQQAPVMRLADVVASVSLATDLATGQVLEHGLRRALLAVWLGEEIGLSREALSEVYYVALLGTIGCAMEAAAFSQYVEDEIAVGERLSKVDPTSQMKIAAFFLGQAAAAGGPLERAKKVAAVATSGDQSARVCRDVSVQIADMLDLGPAIRAALGQCHEQWNGKGPRGLSGDALSMPIRLYQVARDAEVFSRTGGLDAALAVARDRSGKQYDPRIVEAFIPRAPLLLHRLESESTWDAVLAAEPVPIRRLTSDEFNHMAVAIANFIDARSPYTLGHSRAVASLAQGAARHLGLTEAEATIVGRAGLLHDLGRAGVPVTTWDKKTPLSPTELERVKKHPSMTELILARSDALGHLGTLAGMHHERLDGSGYRGLTGSFLPVAARILATADAYQSKLERRPYRDALPEDAAAEWLRAEADAGRLDADSVRAILAAAGREEPRVQEPWPVGLTDREVEVLQLAVQGLSNRDIASTLVVSPKTVGRHIERIYEKTGVSTRVGATLFALQHGLLDAMAVQRSA